MQYVLLGSDGGRVYVKKCGENPPYREIETDFIWAELSCTFCIYRDICPFENVECGGDNA